jgi:NADH-quinone oxidoreductase subunit K
MVLSPLMICLVAACCLLGVGFYGLLTARNLIKLIIMLQILVKTAVLSLVLAGSASGQINMSQNIGITVIVADTIVAVIAIAFAIQIRRQIGSLDVRDLASLKG